MNLEKLQKKKIYKYADPNLQKYLFNFKRSFYTMTKILATIGPESDKIKDLYSF